MAQALADSEGDSDAEITLKFWEFDAIAESQPVNASEGCIDRLSEALSIALQYVPLEGEDADRIKLLIEQALPKPPTTESHE